MHILSRYFPTPGRRLITLAIAFLISSRVFYPDVARGQDALTFFQNYFVTGDYVVGGIGLRGLGVSNAATQAVTGGVSTYASGVLHMSGVPTYIGSGVPQHADIVAAYLYWATIATPDADPNMLAKGTFRGLKIVGTQIAPPGTPACWSSGGGSGNQSGAQRLLVYRADVLRYLPYKRDPVTGRPLGQRLVNDSDLATNGFLPHTVSLPDSGQGGSQSPSSGNQSFLTEGASLLVVYRAGGLVAGQLPALKAVVIYDGGYTFSSINPTMTQTIKGFYQASSSSPIGRMTHIVGDGDVNFKEQLKVNGAVPTGVPSDNPFQGALGSAWDNLTFAVGNLMAGNDASITTTVTPSNPSSTDCLSWGAVVFSTSVQDTDGDGLLDVWETSGLIDPFDGSVVSLPGANPSVRDIFVEIDYMATDGYSNPTQGNVRSHTHLPPLEVLQKIAERFNAQSPPIKIHFDVGNNYQPGAPFTPISPRPEYILPAASALGGDAVAEVPCGLTQTPTCLYPDFPGTLSWKTGFRGVKDAHFDPHRKDIFHYALFAHTLGLPRWRVNDKTLTSIVVSNGSATVNTALAHELAGSVTITVLGAPSNSGLNGTYTASVVASNPPSASKSLTFPTGAASGTYQNWGLAVSDGTPRSNSGVSDVGGGDLMVTLGRWDNFTGSTFIQASTLFHELGHNLDLGHGGDISDPVSCKPNYQSSMSYLFQVRGLLDPNGIAYIDYSGRVLPSLDEGHLNESPSGLGIAPLKYLPRWYAPQASSYLDTIINATPATKHCNGTPITDGSSMVRVDGSTLTASPLDWNADGGTLGTAFSQDINFDGTTTAPSSSQFLGFDDWSNINLRQVGARRNSAATSLNVGPGEDVGDDLGIAGGDLGIAGGDLGIAGGDLGIAGGDLGIAGGDLGIAGGDLGIAGGDLGSELDLEGAKSLGNAPDALAATVVGTNIDLGWTPPHVGSVSQYQVWRATCPRGSTVTTCALSPTTTPVQIGTWAPGQLLCDSKFNFCDTTTKNNTLYLYFVTASVEGKQSGASNQVKKSR